MKLVVSVLLLAVLSAFKNDHSSVLNMQWNLVSVRPDPQAITRPVSNAKAHLMLKEEIFYGNSACNDFRGSCFFAKDSVYFNSPVATKKYCSEIHWIEEALFKSLMPGRAGYNVNKDTLFLFGKNGSVFRFQASRN